MAIDELSRTIGELQADSKEAKQSRQDLYEKVSDIKSSLSEIKTFLISHQTKTDTAIETHGKKIDAHAESLKSLNKTRARAKLMLAAGIGAGGTIGGAISSIVMRVTGGEG